MDNKTNNSISASNQALSHGALFLTAFMWGGCWPATRILVGILNVPPFLTGFYRYFAASLCFIPLLMIMRISPRIVFGRNKKIIVQAGFVYFLCGVFLNLSMIYTTAAQGAILSGFNSTTVALFAFLMYREKLQHKWQYLGFIFSLLGVFFVVGVQTFIVNQPSYLIGNLLVLLSTLSWGYYSSLGRARDASLAPLEYTAGSILVCSLFFGLSSLLEGIGPLSVYTQYEFWSSLFVIGVLTTFLGFTLYFGSMKNIGATRAGSYICLVPVAGSLFSIIFLGEQLSWSILVGLFLVICGIIIINLYPIRQDTEGKDLEEELHPEPESQQVIG
jgi:drug/metabolite transporter (DMT)-like permease